MHPATWRLTTHLVAHRAYRAPQLRTNRNKAASGIMESLVHAKRANPVPPAPSRIRHKGIRRQKRQRGSPGLCIDKQSGQTTGWGFDTEAQKTTKHDRFHLSVSSLLYFTCLSLHTFPITTIGLLRVNNSATMGVVDDPPKAVFYWYVTLHGSKLC